jgi:hypothetical protein
MEPFLNYLYTYVSISGPHLGYLYSSNSLFNSGLWLLKKLKGTQCIHQLTFTDNPDLQNTFFYKLCKVMEKFFLLIIFRCIFGSLFLQTKQQRDAFFLQSNCLAKA